MAAGIATPKPVTANGWLLFETPRCRSPSGNVVRTETILDAFGIALSAKQSAETATEPPRPRPLRRRRPPLLPPPRDPLRPGRQLLLRRPHHPLQRRPRQRLRQPRQPHAKHDSAVLRGRFPDYRGCTPRGKSGTDEDSLDEPFNIERLRIFRDSHRDTRLEQFGY